MAEERRGGGNHPAGMGDQPGDREEVPHDLQALQYLS